MTPKPTAPSFSPRPRTLFATALAIISASLMTLGCTNDQGTRWGDQTSSRDTVATDATAATNDADSSTPSESAKDTKPVVVASTSWVAAFSQAAGVEAVTVIVPGSVQHPNDYDPKPSDLAALVDADYVLYAGFESFSTRLTEAVGSKAELIKVNTVNSPEVIRTEVLKLAEAFGTTEKAERWLAELSDLAEELSGQIDAVRPTPAPKVVVQKFMAPWAKFAGLNVVDTYGPEPLTAGKVADMVKLSPVLILDNAHVPNRGSLDDLGAERIEVINFPPDAPDLLEVFRINTKTIVAALKGL